MKTLEQRKKYNEYMSKYLKQYRKDNPDKVRKMKNNLQNKWRSKNGVKIRGYEKTYADKHPDKVQAKRERRKLKVYGLTPEKYNLMLLSQGGICAICHLARGIRKLAVDHDHETGVVRGLLCQFCNTALGKFLDDIKILKRAIEYLEKPSIGA